MLTWIVTVISCIFPVLFTLLYVFISRKTPIEELQRHCCLEEITSGTVASSSPSPFFQPCKMWTLVKHKTKLSLTYLYTYLYSFGSFYILFFSCVSENLAHLHCLKSTVVILGQNNTSDVLIINKHCFTFSRWTDKSFSCKLYSPIRKVFFRIFENSYSYFSVTFRGGQRIKRLFL